MTTATLDALPATSDTLVVPASDSSALARALSAAGFRAPGQPLHLYLEGGTYTFADPSSAEAPSLPPILNTVVIHGNEAVIRLYDEGGASDSLAVTATGDLTLKHVTLLSGSARAIVNDGRLRLEDSRVANDQGAPDYYLPDGGGIENRGVLEVTRTVFERNRLLSRSAPGGAIWNAGQLTVTCARFVDNVASTGGAVYNATDGEAHITHSLFDGNRANGGGAVFNAAATPVEAGGNWWRGGVPAVNSLYAGVDTVSDGVTFAPVADADPTQNDSACAPVPPEPLPALPRLAAQATRTPTPATTATPSPVGRGLMAPRYIPLPDDEWISFPQFTLSSLDYLSLVDSAVHTQEDAIQLMQGETPTTLYAGALWSPSKQTLSGGFHTAFRFRVTHLVDSGGDGFALVIQNTGTGAVGIGGCSNGYNGIPGVFAVEFDLYWNNYFCAETQDPSDNHLGVMTGNHLHTNPALVYAVPKPTLNFKDGQVHSVVIDYELDPPRLEINLDDGLVTWTANINPAWLPLDGEDKAWVGLVAGQFGARANVDILDWQFEHSQQNPTVTPTPTPTCAPGSTPSPGGCTFTFNDAQRQDAAEYAISWAGNACPQFCAYQFAALATLPAGTPAPMGWDCYPGTDCANFVSQAWLYAGMPMNKSWACDTNAYDLCQRLNTYPYPAGWVSALRTPGQPQYVAERESNNMVIGLGGDDTLPIWQTMTSTPNEQAAFTGQLNSRSANWETPGYVWTPNAPPPGAIPAPVQGLMDRLSTMGFTAGDLMYTDLEGYEHVLIVVGWGPYVETWEQLATVTPQQIQPHRSVNAPVLYVADHGPHGEVAIRTPSAFTRVIAGYKPYYAVWWYADSRDLGPDRVDYVGGNRHFVHVPDSYMLPHVMLEPTSPTIQVTQQAVQRDMRTLCPPATQLP